MEDSIPNSQIEFMVASRALLRQDIPVMIVETQISDERQTIPLEYLLGALVA